MPNVGILGYDATTRDMDCVMIGCFGNLRGRQGSFKAGIKELTSQRAATPQKMNDIVFKRIKIHTEEDEEEK